MAYTETRNRVASRKSQESMASSVAGLMKIGRHRFELGTGCESEPSGGLDFDMTASGG